VKINIFLSSRQKSYMHFGSWPSKKNFTGI